MPIDETKLRELMGRLEADWIERTRSSQNTDKLAEAMKILGYVNRYGRGIIKAERELEKNGNPAPEFDFSNLPYSLVTVRRAP